MVNFIFDISWCTLSKCYVFFRYYWSSMLSFFNFKVMRAGSKFITNAVPQCLRWRKNGNLISFFWEFKKRKESCFCHGIQNWDFEPCMVVIGIWWYHKLIRKSSLICCNRWRRFHIWKIRPPYKLYLDFHIKTLMHRVCLFFVFPLILVLNSPFLDFVDFLLL